MLLQLTGFALLAALSPTALLVSAVFLGAASPRLTAVVYLAGALLMTVIMATIVFLVLRAGHLNQPHEHQARYGLRLGLGLLTLAVGLYLMRRKPRVKDPASEHQGLIARMIARPSPKTAFIVGLILYSPSLTFIAAVQVVATATESATATILLLALVIAVTVAFVWLPLVLYLITPDRTGRMLASFNGWLRSHGRKLFVAALLIAGTVIALDGILGLTGVVT
jgi:Sap, sulfolipid-1-addressing protein